MLGTSLIIPSSTLAPSTSPAPITVASGIFCFPLLSISAMNSPYQLPNVAFLPSRSAT